MTPRTLAIAGAAVALAACTAASREPLHPVKTAYRSEPAPRASSRPDIRRHMNVLAEELLTLTALTAASTPASASRRQEVIDTLDRIDARARRVGGGGAVTNHPLVDEHMDGFLEDVALSREFARREPPNLVPANRLVQSCLACHNSL